MSGLLQNNGPFTVFAPTNAAFDAFGGNATRQDILYHMVQGRISGDEVARSNAIKTALGKDIFVSQLSGQVYLNESASISIRDVQAGNGVIHVIDAVLDHNNLGGGGSGGDDRPGGGGGDGGDFDPVASGTTVVNVTNGVALGGAKRLGVNLGGIEQYGARQLMDNIMPNPGFESAEFAMVFIAYDGASANKVQADYWLTSFNNDQLNIGQPAGFWNNAQFEILSGAGAGRAGTVSSFTFEGGRYTFNLSGGGAAPAQGSVIMVRKDIGGYDFNTLPFAKAAPGRCAPAAPANNRFAYPQPTTSRLRTQNSSTATPVTSIRRRQITARRWQMESQCLGAFRWQRRVYDRSLQPYQR